MQPPSIPVKNAGLILLNSYLPLLFERLALIKDKKFTDNKAASRAIYVLEYVATGIFEAEEALLSLNKLLCGQQLTQPLEPVGDITDDEKTLIDGLIKAAIGYWPAIGDTSIDGFRGNWLVRNGLLSVQEDRHELTVEKRPYDILIHKSPFSFSIIKYPWMDKPLHVIWPY